MLILILLVAVLLSFTAFSNNNHVFEGWNPLYSFYLIVVKQILGNILVSGFGFVILTLIISRILKFDKKLNYVYKFIGAAKQAFLVFFIGLLLSSLVIYAIAITELNVMALLININPGAMGVIDNISDISMILNKRNEALEIITVGKGVTPGVVAVAIAATGKNSFYAQAILPSIPEFAIMPIKASKSSLMLVDNQLIIDNRNNADFSQISPLVAMQIMKQTFPNRTIKPTPNVKFVDRQTYTSFRQKELLNKLVKMDDQIGSYDVQSRELEAQIKLDGSNILEKEEALNTTYRKREADYHKCINLKKSEVVCKNSLTDWDEEIIQATNTVNEGKLKLEDDEKILKDNQDYIDVIKAQKSLLSVLENNIVQEYGQYVPPETIYLTEEEMDKRNTAEYFETMVHEYLHYASFISDKRILDDSFWEEGLTEFFARKAIKKSLGQETNIGYPAAVKIISQITKRIPESEMTDIYFEKDQAKLEETLDRVYGDGFYKNNRIILTLIQYTTDPAQTLKYANNFMQKIGGEQMVIEDILSFGKE